jgi:hypothetical protein
MSDFVSLIICSEYEPYSIIERLSPYLAGSASIVVHSPYPQASHFRTTNESEKISSQIVVDLQAKLHNLPEYLCPTITEAWLRRYQVCPVGHILRFWLTGRFFLGVAWTNPSNDVNVWFGWICLAYNQNVRYMIDQVVLFLTSFSSHDDPSAEFTPRERKRKNKTPKVEVESSTDADKADDGL